MNEEDVMEFSLSREDIYVITKGWAYIMSFDDDDELAYAVLNS